MADDDEYDFSDISNVEHYDIENSVLSKWRSQNEEEEEEDDDYSYFWPDQPPYDIDEKLREINKVHEQDETPLESNRPHLVKFNKRVQMRAISMRHVASPDDHEDEDEPFDIHKYETDETVADGETVIRPAAGAAGSGQAAAKPGQAAARPDYAVARYGHVAAGPGQAAARVDHVATRADHVAAGPGQAAARVGHVAARADHVAAGPGQAAARVGYVAARADHVAAGPGQAAARVGHVAARADYVAAGPGQAAARVGHVAARADHVAAGPSQAAAKHVAPPPSRVPVVHHMFGGKLGSEAQYRTMNKTVVSRLSAAPPGVSRYPATKGLTPPRRRGFSEAQNLPFEFERDVAESYRESEQLAEDRLSVLSLTDDDGECAAPAAAPCSDSGYSSWPAAEPPQLPQLSQLSRQPSAVRSLYTQTDMGAAPARPPQNATILPRPTACSGTEQPPAGAAEDQVDNIQTDRSANVCAKSNDAAGVTRDDVAALRPADGQAGAAPQEASPAASQVSTGQSAEQSRPDEADTPAADVPRSEDSAVEPMDDRAASSQCSSDGRSCDGRQPLPPPPPEPQRPAAATTYLRHQTAAEPHPTRKRSASKSVGTSSGENRLSVRPARAVRQSERCTSATAVGSGRDGPAHGRAPPARTTSPVKGADRASPERRRPRPHSAPTAQAAGALGRRGARTRSAARQAAAATAEEDAPPLRRVRQAASKDPSLSFQQWLIQHEKERAKAVEESKNSAKKRKQEATIKKEQSPLAFRVWLRKKHQQKLIEQRVQQLRQHEILASVEQQRAPTLQQEDAFRLWLQRKQRDRVNSAPPRSKMTLRCLANLYTAHPGTPGGVARPPHGHLEHIYGPHTSRVRRSRSAHLSGS